MYKMIASEHPTQGEFYLISSLKPLNH